jgi:NTE family protein
VTDWAAGLPRPVALVLSGGASLGAIQVGMLQALADAGLRPDLVVGTSVGSLNGAVVAEHETLEDAAAALEDTWQRLRRRDVFPNGPGAQTLSVLRTGYLQEQRGLRHVITRTLRARSFEALTRPLTVVTADVLTSHVRWFGSGALVPPLLAATAIPGVFPPVLLAGRLHGDAGSVANVPLQAALGRGAASLVVLDAGDICHLDVPPRGIPDALLGSAMTAMRQRALIEAPLVADRVPVLYLPRPCGAEPFIAGPRHQRRAHRPHARGGGRVPRARGSAPCRAALRMASSPRRGRHLTLGRCGPSRPLANMRPTPVAFAPGFT